VLASVSIGIMDTLVKVASYYLFDEVWNKKIVSQPKPAVIWLTGLSGSGKTTIADRLVAALNEKEVKSVKLDGDEIRNAIKLHGFDEDSRKKHNLNVGYIASLFEKQGNIVIVSLISPYRDVRDEVRTMCNRFIEIYLATPLDICIARDPKGLYKKALSGEIKDFTGISAPYEEPLNPELSLDTSTMDVNGAVEKIMYLLKK
jgi:adenylylsulfate kinase